MGLSRIFEEFSSLEYGAALPREGDLNFFYDQFVDVGVILVKERDRYHVFYVDHDDIIDSIRESECRWILEPAAASLVIGLLQKIENDFLKISFQLSLQNSDHRDMLGQLIGDKFLNVHFLSLLYGELFKTKSLGFVLPDHVCAQIREALDMDS